MDKGMEKENNVTLLDLLIRVIGWTENITGKENIHFLVDKLMKEILLMEKEMEKESIGNLMSFNIKVIVTII